MRNLQQRLPLVATLLLFIALCAATAYWSMQLFKPPLRMVAAPPPPAPTEPNLDAAASLFGGRMAAVAAASNFQLRGVIDAGVARESIAILSADGKPALAVRVGAELMPGVTVREVHPRYVLLSDSGVIKRVDLPDNAPPGSGTIAPVGNQPMPQFAPQTVPAPQFTPPPAAPPSVPPRVIYNAVPDMPPAQQQAPNANPPATQPQPQVAAPPTAAPAQPPGTIPPAGPGVEPVSPPGNRVEAAPSS